MADFAGSTYNLAVHVTTITIGLSFPFAALGALASKAIDRHRETSERDALTGLLNRRGFEKQAMRMYRADREGAVVICDLDHFKEINDRFGHTAGDLVLIEVGAEIEGVMGRHGCTSRFGGEEFIVYLPASSLEQAAELAETLRTRLAQMDWQSKGIHRQITATFGIATVNGMSDQMKIAIERADQALYSAKRLGRNQVMVAGVPRPLSPGAPPDLRSIA